MKTRIYAAPAVNELNDEYAAVQSQQTVSAHFTSKQMQPVGLARHYDMRMRGITYCRRNQTSSL